METMEFRVLGPLEVIGPRGPIRIAGRLRRALLTLLVLHHGETVTTDQLIDQVWGDDAPGGADHALVVHVAGLRQALGADRIEGQPNGYRLRAEGSAFDLERLDALVAEGSRTFAAGDPQTATASFAKALALWRGPALGDLGVGSAAQAERARLDELRALVLERWIDAELTAGHHLDVVPDLRRVVDQMPLREAFQARLMLALNRSGRQSEALEVYHRARAILDKELGVDPGPELESLQRAILAHDPGLAVAAPAELERRSMRLHDVRSALTQAPLPPQSAIRSNELAAARGATRRNVTALIADLTAMTVTGEQIDPEVEGHPLDRGFHEIQEVIERHGGLVEHLAGDTVLAVFGIPIAVEDDAFRAVRAASEMRDAVAALNASLEREVSVRMTMRAGINTGEVVATRDVAAASLVRGEAVNAASTLEQASGPNEILIAQATYRLVRSVVEVESVGEIDARGRSGPINAFRLLAVTPRSGGHHRRFDTALVGRDRELRLLEAAFNRVITAQRCELFSLLGPAGVGKSRLIQEFLGSVRSQAQVLRSRCLPYGERALWPVVETIRQAAAITKGDDGEVARAKIAALAQGHPRAQAVVERVAGLLGASDAPSTGEETTWAVRTVFEAIARRRPLVVVFDDVQWGEPLVLDLIETVAGSARGAPILFICIARPELVDARPHWGGGKLNATSVLLEPLGDIEVAQLVANLLGGSKPSAAVERRIVDVAEGNPLFVEEFLAMMLDEGVLRRTDREWVAAKDLSAISTPASITALLSARLDRLPADEQEVAGAASVIGKVFDRAAVHAQMPGVELSDLDRRLESLARREVLRPDGSTSEDADAYRFKHILIRDAAYTRLPKAERIVLHERLSDWLAFASQRDDEAIGAHLEQAYRYRIALGPLDDRAREVGRAAAKRLAEAGRRAHTRGDAGAAASLLVRAAALLPPEGRERLLLLHDLTQSLSERGEVDAARQTNDELIARAEAAGFEDLGWRARVNRIWIDVATTGVSRQATSDARAALAFFEKSGDQWAIGRTWNLIAALALFSGQMAEYRPANEKSLEHARRAGDIRGEARALNEIAWADVMGPATIGVATQTAHRLLDWSRAAGMPWTEAIALAHVARLKAMVGDFEKARTLVGSAIAIIGELGLRLNEASDGPAWIATIEALAGDPIAAERSLRRGYEELEPLGETRTRGYVAAELARMLYRQDRFDEAYEYAQAAEGWAWGPGSPPASTRAGVMAMILARRGDTAAALALAFEAVSMAERTDLILVHGQALEDLAEVLKLSGRADEARPHLAKAIAIYDQKGITVLADRARAKAVALLQ